MSKIISIAMLLAAALGLYVIRVQMSKLDEEVVYAHYQKSIDATQMFDAKTLCGMMDRDYRAVDVAKTPRGEERTDMNRKQACTAMRESMAMMKEVVAATRLKPDFKYVIESVTLTAWLSNTSTWMPDNSGAFFTPSSSTITLRATSTRFDDCSR